MEWVGVGRLPRQSSQNERMLLQSSTGQEVEPWSEEIESFGKIERRSGQKRVKAAMDSNSFRTGSLK
jgi:hypothetical protein